MYTQSHPLSWCYSDLITNQAPGVPITGFPAIITFRSSLWTVFLCSWHQSHLPGQSNHFQLLVWVKNELQASLQHFYKNSYTLVASGNICMFQSNVIKHEETNETVPTWDHKLNLSNRTNNTSCLLCRALHIMNAGGNACNQNSIIYAVCHKNSWLVFVKHINLVNSMSPFFHMYRKVSCLSPISL